MISHSLTGSSEDRPWPSAMATADQVWAAGAGNWSVPSTCALGTRTANASTRDDRADEDAGELGEKLLAGVGAEQVAALQVGEQVGR